MLRGKGSANAREVDLMVVRFDLFDIEQDLPFQLRQSAFVFGRERHQTFDRRHPVPMPRFAGYVQEQPQRIRLQLHGNFSHPFSL